LRTVTSRFYDDLDAVAEALGEALGISIPDRVYDCDAKREELENGREYGCQWSVKIIVLDKDTEQNS
jgi:hypothetical protein